MNKSCSSWTHPKYTLSCLFENLLQNAIIHFKSPATWVGQPKELSRGPSSFPVGSSLNSTLSNKWPFWPPVWIPYSVITNQWSFCNSSIYEHTWSRMKRTLEPRTWWWLLMMHLVIIFLPNPNYLVTRIKVLLVSQTLGQGTGKIENITDSRSQHHWNAKILNMIQSFQGSCFS